MHHHPIQKAKRLLGEKRSDVYISHGVGGHSHRCNGDAGEIRPGRVPKQRVKDVTIGGVGRHVTQGNGDFATRRETTTSNDRRGDGQPGRQPGVSKQVGQLDIRGAIVAIQLQGALQVHRDTSAGKQRMIMDKWTIGNPVKL